MFRAAKETIAIAEEISMQGANKKRDFDSALQELLNHATSKVSFPIKKTTDSKEYSEIPKDLKYQYVIIKTWNTIH